MRGGSAESRVSPRKSDRQGLFYGEGEGAGSDASISGHAGMESHEGESAVWAGDQGDRAGSGTVGSVTIKLGGPTDPGAGKPSLQSSAQPRAALPSWGGGDTFSLETLDTNFGFLARKISLVWKGGGGRVSEGRSTQAAEQTLRIRFQRLRPTPSPSAVICVRGSVTL